MQRHLLTRDPYRSYGVTLDQLFDDGSFRVHEDLYLLSDQVFGWDSNYDVLRGAGVEGVRAHPGDVCRGVARTIWHELAKAQFRSPELGSRMQAAREPTTVVITGSGFPRRPKASRSRPGQVRLDLASRPEHPPGLDLPTDWHFEFAHRRTARASTTSSARRTTCSRLPDRHGNAQLALRLDQLSRWFPRPWMWIVRA